MKRREVEEGTSMQAWGGGHREETGEEEEKNIRKRQPGPPWGRGVGKVNRPQPGACERVADPQPLQAGLSCPRTVLPSFCQSPEAAAARASASGTLTRGKGRQERRGLQAGWERSLRPREELLSGGRAGWRAGAGVWGPPLPPPVRGGAWPLLPRRPHPCRRCQI